MECTDETIDGSRGVIVLGMHRSGTSALTRVLNLHGLYLGDDLMPAAVGNNETGFWEHRQIQHVHEKILIRLYRRWNSAWPIPSGWPDDAEIVPLREQLKEIVQRDFGSHRLWGLKDPRTCFLIEIWRSILAELNVKPAMVLIFRNPAEIAQSLERRDGMPASQAYLIWLWSLLLTERETRGMSRSLTSYEALLSNWESEIVRIGHELDLAWPVSSEDVRAEIGQFLTPTLRHNLVDDQAFLQAPDIPEIVKRGYEAVLAGLKGDMERLSATVDELWEELATTQPLVSTYLLDLEHQHREVIGQRDALAHRVKSAEERAAVTESIVSAADRMVSAGDRMVSAAGSIAEDGWGHFSSHNGRTPTPILRKLTETGTGGLATAKQGSPDNGDGHRTMAAVEGRNEFSSRMDTNKTSETSQGRRPGEQREVAASLENGAETLETAVGTLETAVENRLDKIERAAKWMQRWRSRSARYLYKARARSNDLSRELEASRLSEGRIQQRALTLEWELVVRRVWPSYDGFKGLARFHGALFGKITAQLARMARLGGRLLGGQSLERARLGEDIRLVKRSGLFDAKFYHEQNPDVNAAGLDLLEHYVRWGGFEGRKPNLQFDSQYYFSENKDVAAHWMNPLLHFVSRGAAEGRWPFRFFNPLPYMEGTLPAEEATALDAFLWRLLGRIDLLVVAAPDRLRTIERAALTMRRARRFTTAAVTAAIHRLRVLGPGAFVRDMPMLARQAVDYYRALKLPPPGKEPGLFARTSRYEAWQSVNKWTAGAENDLRDRLSKAASLPRISVLMPVYNPPTQFLESAIESVRGQVYQDWELCIADDKSTDDSVVRVLNKWAAKDPRIKVTFRDENGHISRATNTAAELATGEFLVFLDHDDELTPDALGEVALYLAENPECDFVYSDSDKIDESGRRYDPEFKPAWSPELLLSYMYFTHLCAVRRNLFEEVGRIRAGFEGSQDYDLALRATEKARKVGHIPQIFYHWRATEGSTALSGAAKPESFAAGERAVQEAMERRGLSGKVARPDWAESGRLGIFSADFPDEGPSVEILIPTRNGLPALRRCIESLKQTSYRNFKVTVLDNESDDADALHYLEHCGHRVLKVSTGGKFNFAALNNRGVQNADAEFVLLLNNDTEIISEQWLSRMVGYARQEGVGAVGARLLYPDGRVQHAGVLHGLHDGLAGHAFKLLSRWDGGYLGHAKLTRNYSAVTAACMLTPRRLYLEQGGLDEEHFAVAYNDCDYCYRLADAGYRCVYVAGAELIHHEGTSRGFKDSPAEVAAYRGKYGRRVDRYYSPHLSLEDENFNIKPVRAPRGKLKKMRTCVVSNSLNYTGAPATQYEVVMALANRGVIEPFVVCVQDGPLRESYEKHGIEVHVFPEHPFAPVFGRPELFDQTMKDLGRRLKDQWKAELVYVNTLQPVYAIEAASRAGIPSIWNVHESDGWKEHFPWPAIVDRCLECLRKPYRVIFGSHATQELFATFDGMHNFTTIPSALDLTRLESLGADWTRASARESFGITENDLVFLIVGTVCERKGQIDLIQAMHRLPKDILERARVFVVGDRKGPYSTELRRLVKELGPVLSERVSVIEETPDVARYYRAADVFVGTSRIECYPRVTLEAMAFGLPLITTPVFGIREQVRDGVNGLFYEPGNIVQLCDAMLKLAKDNRVRQQMGAQSPLVLASLVGFEEAIDRYQQAFEGAFLTGL